VLDRVHVADVEQIDSRSLGGPFDLLLFSHILEHLRDPAGVVRSLIPCLRRGGYVLIAVPNTLEWRARYKLLRGRFEYADHGTFDRTHLRFFTYDSAPAELVAPLPQLKLLLRRGRGAAPLGPFRRWLLPAGFRARIDNAAVRLMPNLFAGEVAMLAKLHDDRTPPPQPWNTK
jgi:SAM-dependent methyltransferase